MKINTIHLTSYCEIRTHSLLCRYRTLLKLYDMAESEELTLDKIRASQECKQIVT